MNDKFNFLIMTFLLLSVYSPFSNWSTFMNFVTHVYRLSKYRILDGDSFKPSYIKVFDGKTLPWFQYFNGALLFQAIIVQNLILVFAKVSYINFYKRNELSFAIRHY